MKKTFHKSFRFLDWKLNTKDFTLSLSYKIQEVGQVTEVLSFPEFNIALSKQHNINKACELIHLLCGVSYYKAGLATEISFKNQNPSPLLSQFIEKTWFNGLAELAYENNISLKGHIKIPFNDKLIQQPAVVTLNNCALVPLGGGKDSLVTVEELKQKDRDICLFMVGSSKLIKEMASFIDLPLIQVTRKIDQKLIEYNKGNAFNGHIPITAINSAIAILSALLFDCNEIVFSNERSADSANTLNADGEKVNHQYSKSYEFEKDLTKVLHQEITPNINYYSLQRPYSELAILKKFSRYPQYFPIFSSCNRNFHIDGSKNKQSRWCCDCPKCRFVFLGLAAFLDKAQLIQIFKHNMLDDVSQKKGYSELLGLTGFKPFECVGEIIESQIAFDLIKKKTEWQDDSMIKYFYKTCPQTTKKQYQQIMQASTTHSIP